MAQSNKKQQKYSSLSDIQVPQNWTEMTGSFFYLKTTDGKSFGPFHPNDISDYIDECGLSTETQIKDAKGLSDWQSLYAHALFQRRRPSLVPTADNAQIENLMILRDGKPHGPLAIRDIEDLIENKGLISTDAVSLDKGRTWIKLYQVPGFDQRSYSAAELPMNPGKKSSQNTNQKNNDASGQMANLVYIESQKQELPKSKQDNLTETNKEKTQLSLKRVLVLGLIVLAVITYFLLDGQEQANNLIPGTKTSKELTKKTKAKVENKNTVKRKPAVKRGKAKKAAVRKNKKPAQAKMPRTRKPKSFTSTPAFQDRKKLEDDALINDDYDNGQGDIENDPVRKAVSKETLFPEEAELLEPEAEMDIYRDEEQDFESDESEIISAEDVWNDDPSRDGKNPKDPFEEQ